MLSSIPISLSETAPWLFGVVPKVCGVVASAIATLRMMARKIYSPFWQLVGSRLLLNLSSISLLSVPVCLFRLMLERWLYRVDSDVPSANNEGLVWSESRFVFVCKLVEMIREAPNDTAYKRWICHSGLKLLCKLCRTFPPPAIGARFTILGMPAMRTR